MFIIQQPQMYITVRNVKEKPQEVGIITVALMTIITSLLKIIIHLTTGLTC